MTEIETLYQSLPEIFSPKQAIEKVIELDFDKDWLKSRSWIQSVIDSWMLSNRIERAGRGVYRKLKQRRVQV